MVQGVGGSGLEQGARHPTVQIEMHEFGAGSSAHARVPRTLLILLGKGMERVTVVYV